MPTTLNKIDLKLKKLSEDPQNIKDYSRFYRDGRVHISLTTPLLRELSAESFREIKDKKKSEIFSLCNKLLATNKNSHRIIALDWAFRLKKRYEKEDFRVFETWLKKYVDTWDSCDDLCTRSFGQFIYQFPEFLTKTIVWTKSSNKWLRRASAVVLIYSLRRKKCLNQALNVAKILLQDKEDLVQKGYGWMLKEASGYYLNEISDFVMKHKAFMPRTALRYAVEKFPEKLRKKAMIRAMSKDRS